MPPTPLLRLLADGRFHSGAELAAALGLSRTAIWKQVARLPELGIDVHAVRGRGYRIPGGIDLLDGGRIRALLPSAAGRHLGILDVFDSVDSTNSVAASWARAGGGAYVCLAERQTAGRGRRGRQWISPFAANIYLTATWEFQGGVNAIAGLSLAVGVVVCDVVRKLGVVDAGLKWPNDIVVGPAKLGGILIELNGDIGGACRAVIGLGLNVRMPPAAAREVDQAWTDLSASGAGDAGRNGVVAALLGELLPALALFEREGLAPFLSRWREYDVCHGREVEVISGPVTIAGVAAGIDAAGALVLETAAGTRVVSGGEVSLRRKS